MASHDDEARRALAFMARVDERAATEVRPWSFGTALITPELPKVWDASYFRVEDLDADDAERVVAETVEAAHAAGLAHVAVVVTDDGTASRLAPGLLREGFEEARFVLMALREVPPDPAEEVAEVSFTDVAPSRRQMTLEMFPGDEALADQLEELNRRLERTIGGRWFRIRDDGEGVSRPRLLERDGLGQGDDRPAEPGHRRAGPGPPGG